MLTISKNNQIIVGIVLAALVIVTRGHHFASINVLPSASIAAFFLAGVYLRPMWVFPAFLALCAGLDFSAITVGNTSDFCVTPAYGFMLPAYGSLWLAGRWFANHYSFNWKTLVPLGGSMLVAAFVSEVLSSGGFYFFGGRYADPTLTEFGHRLVKYFPHQIENLAFWVGIAAIVHIAFALIQSTQHAKS